MADSAAPDRRRNRSAGHGVSPLVRLQPGSDAKSGFPARATGVGPCDGLRLTAGAARTIPTVSAPTLAALIGILVNHTGLGGLSKRIDELRAGADRRFDAMEKVFTETLFRVEQVMDARIKHREEGR
jgi:hypothetical protein